MTDAVGAVEILIAWLVGTAIGSWLAYLLLVKVMIPRMFR